jgi:Flp pilus assembly pilin Flp
MMARSGQALVEYVLLIALVAVALIASLLLFRGVLAERLVEVSETVESHMPGAEPQDPGAQPPGGGGNLPPRAPSVIELPRARECGLHAAGSLPL